MILMTCFTNIRRTKARLYLGLNRWPCETCRWLHTYLHWLEVFRNPSYVLIINSLSCAGGFASFVLEDWDILEILADVKSSLSAWKLPYWRLLFHDLIDMILLHHELLYWKTGASTAWVIRKVGRDLLVVKHMRRWLPIVSSYLNLERISFHLLR